MTSLVAPLVDFLKAKLKRITNYIDRMPDYKEGTWLANASRTCHIAVQKGYSRL